MKYISASPPHNLIRGTLARQAAQTYIVSLLLDASEHAGAFEGEELTEAEREIARAEIERIGIEILHRYKCEL